MLGSIDDAACHPVGRRANRCLSWAPPAGAPPAHNAVYDAGTLVTVTTGTAVRVDRLYPATAHRFTVAGLDTAGNESTHSAPAGAATQPCLAVPPRPVALSATALSASSIRLGWTLEAAAGSYTVDDGDTAVATSRYPDMVLTGLPSGSWHAYRVSATLTQGCSETPRSARRAHGAPGRAAGLSVTGNTPTGMAGTQLTLAWPASASADPAVGYRVYEGATMVGETAGTTPVVRGRRAHPIMISVPGGEVRGGCGPGEWCPGRRGPWSGPWT